MQNSLFLISLALGAVAIASLLFLPALVLSIGWRAVAPLADDDDGDWEPTFPEPSSVQRARLEARH